MAKKSTPGKIVEALKHDEATRKNIPTAEYQSVLQKNEQDPVRVAYPRGVNGRNEGLAEEKQQRNRATATSTLSSSGAARTSKTGATSSFTRRRSTSRRRSTPRR